MNKLMFYSYSDPIYNAINYYNKYDVTLDELHHLFPIGKKKLKKALINKGLKNLVRFDESNYVKVNGPTLEYFLEQLCDKNGEIYRKSFVNKNEQSRVQIMVYNFLQTKHGQDFFNDIPKLYQIRIRGTALFKMTHTSNIISDFKYFRIVREILNIYNKLAESDLKIYLHPFKLYLRYRDYQDEDYYYEHDRSPLCIEHINKGSTCAVITSQSQKQSITFYSGENNNVLIKNMNGKIEQPIKWSLMCKPSKRHHYLYQVIYQKELSDLEMNWLGPPRTKHKQIIPDKRIEPTTYIDYDWKIN